MSWYRKNPLFAIGLTLFALVVLGELALIYERWAESRAVAKRLEQRKIELQGMTELTPPPTREVAAAIEADLKKAQAALASMQAELKGRGPAAERLHNAKVPAARTDAYFDLATFIERTREIARKHDVDIRPDASHLGFSVYAKEPPEMERIEPVFRQKLIAQYLIESLIEARPRAIFAVKRERTVTKAEKEARAAAIANGETLPEPDYGDESADYFTIHPGLTARVPGFVDTTAFRFVFTGQTAALRTFLNRLAAFELPVLVREVEVAVATSEEATAPEADEAAPAEQAAPAGPVPASVVLSVETPATPPGKAATRPAARPARPSTATPIVSKPLSKFTVTVEFIELVVPPPPS